MRFSRIVLALISLLLGVVVAGCSGDEAGSGEVIVAGFYPLAFAAEQIRGDAAQVQNLTSAGAEPHDLELTAGDVRTVRDAALVLYLGGGFQPALEAALEERTGPSLDLLRGQRLLDRASATGRDPHVWLDPTRFVTMARAIAAELGEPRSADELVGRLGRLDLTFRRGLETCARREIVTSHAAFGYLAARYGLRQISLTGISPEANPTPKDLQRLVDRVRREGATTIFVETLVAPDLAETVARESGATTATLNPLEGLTSDQIDDGADYFSVMRENLAALRQALGCR